MLESSNPIVDELISEGHEILKLDLADGDNRKLQDEVKKMGLSPDTKFTPEVQDNIFFSHAKRVGNISPWVGPSVKYDAAERARLNDMIQGF